MNQTIALLVPSVVVAIGAVDALPAIAEHQAIVGTGGLAAEMRTATTARPVTPPGHMLAPFVVLKTKYWPIAVL